MYNETITIPLLPGECWWGGAVQDGTHMPFGALPHRRDLSGDLAYNQGNPRLLSNKGRYVWSDEPFRFALAEGQLTIEGEKGTLTFGADGGNLRGAFLQASRNHFPPSGTYPDMQFFNVPQYNTWMEMSYEPTQAKVIAYAEAILEHGLPPGILMIDDNWHEDYGTLEFHPGRFPDPRGMIDLAP